MLNGAAASHDSAQAAPSRHPATSCTLQEAAAVLGVSLNTLRRKIRSGEVAAERVRRPQGYVWRVELPEDQPAGQQSAGTLPLEAPGTLQQQAPDLQRAEAMASYSRALLEPLVARLAEQEQIIREQAEDLGRLRAELEHAREGPTARHQTATDARGTAEGPDPPSEPPEPPSAPSPAPAPIPPQPNGGSPWWRRWWVAITGV